MRVISLPRRFVGAHDSVGVLMELLPTIGHADRTHLHVAHLAAGGTIGRHPATLTQVFAIIQGDGRVTGDDGVSRPIAAGQAAVWEPGEDHQSWASTDLIAVILETTGELRLDDHPAEP